jgi:hypothetical protein
MSTDTTWLEPGDIIGFDWNDGELGGSWFAGTCTMALNKGRGLNCDLCGWTITPGQLYADAWEDTDFCLRCARANRTDTDTATARIRLYNAIQREMNTAVNGGWLARAAARARLRDLWSLV